MRKKTLISWSSGKDSAWTLHVLKQDPTIEIVGLFCTVNQFSDRVAIHGVRRELLLQQAESVNLPVEIIYIPYPCSNVDYATIMTSFVTKARQRGIDCFAFGDLFLEDIRMYRETLLRDTGITPLFPLWGIPTKTLSQQMVSNGLKAIITCINAERFSQEYAGRKYDESFLEEIPAGIDPCGENGEFHSFAFDGPMFQYPINVSIGQTIHRDGAYFTDLLTSSCKRSVPSRRNNDK
jgi:uncharacterized protein (TIGR00290 family)